MEEVEGKNVRKRSEEVRKALIEYVSNPANLSTPKTVSAIAAFIGAGKGTTSRHLQLLHAQGKLPANVTIERVGSSVLTMKVN